MQPPRKVKGKVYKPEQEELDGVQVLDNGVWAAEYDGRVAYFINQKAAESWLADCRLGDNPKAPEPTDPAED